MAQSVAAVVQSVELPEDFDLLALHELRPDRYPFLLESVASAASAPAAEGPFDILFAFPGEVLHLDGAFRLHGAAGEGQPGFLLALDDWWRTLRQGEPPPGRLPFHGGWFLFLGYELAREIEPGIPMPAPLGGPVALATRIPVALIRDRSTGQAWIVAEPGHAGNMALVAGDLLECGMLPASLPVPLVDSVREPDPAAFLAGVGQVRERITRGDVYQVNLARHWQASLRPDTRPADIYRSLRRTNPAPYAGIARLGEFTVISSSPERLLRCRNGSVDTRPIAGTRPTASNPAGEAGQRRDLLANPKERAEHIMLIDLERNDLGRICAPGTVEVDELMVVETYSHVHHIVSNVRGRLRPDTSPGAVIRAMFPGGTITGCPKVRCMELIGELEARPRGPYTGSMGYLNLDGSCDLNILIRSFVVRGRELSFAAGSGIVADSEPLRELEETRAKAKGLLLALGT